MSSTRRKIAGTNLYKVSDGHMTFVERLDGTRVGHISTDGPDPRNGWNTYHMDGTRCGWDITLRDAARELDARFVPAKPLGIE